MKTGPLQLFLVLSLLGSHVRSAEDSKSEELAQPVPTMKPFIAVWRLLGPRIMEKDSQRTVTRRESSLIVPLERFDDDTVSILTLGTSRDVVTASESSFLLTRPKGAIRKELVTVFFESMLDSIVDKWQVLATRSMRSEEYATPDEKSLNEPNMKKRKSMASARPNSLKSKRSRSKLEVSSIEAQNVDALQRVWWSGPDERVVIHFKNGNIYEGGISMKSMDGNGRFQWADGTIYLGNFKNNEIVGKGKICWKDDTWYEGDFVGNIRHGNGLFVDSRGQRSYVGGWHNGTKHGYGIMHYAESSYKNSYEGDWEQNVRHGYGLREYCKMSGYQGTFENSIREGKGLMIWPNHDFYRGGWKNGTMSGKGMYIWDIFYNYTMTLPCQTVYIGDWLRGERHGNGVLTLGLGFGALYKGQFKHNKKHGEGKFITSNGLILRNKNLFVDDNFGSLVEEESEELIEQSNIEDSARNVTYCDREPYVFDMCDERVGLIYHVHQAYKNIDRNEEEHSNVLNEYFESNKLIEPVQKSRPHRRESTKSYTAKMELFFDIDEFFTAEETFLCNSIKCYEGTLKAIYHKYATICNTEDIYFKPVLIRLFLWQLFFDCNIHKKGLTFVEIDKLLKENTDWQLRTTHYPFQKIIFWQFVHALICIAIKLYGKRALPGPRPDNICGLAFRKLMDCDIIPGSEYHKGHLVNGHALYIPLRGLYKLYHDLGEPHSIRKFISAVRKSPHDVEETQPRMHDTPYDDLEMGYNAYVVGDDMRYIVDDSVFNPKRKQEKSLPPPQKCTNPKFKLFNFANIPTRNVLMIFAEMFPQMMCDGKLMNLDIDITFFEFFEAFVSCIEESNRIADYNEISGETQSESQLELISY